MHDTANNTNEPYMMAGDVGGTKTRIGLFRWVRGYPVFEQIQIFPSAAYAGLESVLEDYLKNRQVSVAGACFGIAGPVKKGKCQATNIPWVVSEKALRDRFSWKHVSLINDLVAMGSATPYMKEDELMVLQEGDTGRTGTQGLIAPGTGLGMSLTVKVNEHSVTLPSEGGHMDFAPNCEEETELWRHIHKVLGHVSVERIVSGPGLVNIYRWLLDKNKTEKPVWLEEKMRLEDPAKVISETALNGKDFLCRRALEIFVSVLGAVAGNLALIGLTHGGIYLGGGIVPKILPFLKQDHFLHSFADKGRFRQLLETIPVCVILNDRAALLGAAVHLHNLTLKL